jgi:hypothetical protein
MSSTLAPNDAELLGPYGITLGVINEESTDLYTESQCYALAIALSISCRYHIRLLAVRNSRTEKHLLTNRGSVRKISYPVPTAYLKNSWSHAVVLTERDLCLDITGVKPAAELLVEWGSMALVPSTPRQIRDLLEVPGDVLDRQVALAQHFVAPLLATLT